MAGAAPMQWARALLWDGSWPAGHCPNVHGFAWFIRVSLPRRRVCPKEQNQATKEEQMTSRVEKSIEIDRDVRTVYNQWTQFEDFPHFMQGVEKVTQLDDKRLHWQADIGMVQREWDAEIIEQTPDQVIAWRAAGDVRNDGRVAFEPLGPSRTRATVVFEYDPESFAEKAGDALNITDKRIEGDLKRFKEFIEERGTETGAWRGEVHGGRVQR
jgi:uncharacterized membrane protein